VIGDRWSVIAQRWSSITGYFRQLAGLGCCSAGVPPAMVANRTGLVTSAARRGRYIGRWNACSAGVPPAMVVNRCG